MRRTQRDQKAVSRLMKPKPRDVNFRLMRWSDLKTLLNLALLLRRTKGERAFPWHHVGAPLAIAVEEGIRDGLIADDDVGRAILAEGNPPPPAIALARR